MPMDRSEVAAWNYAANFEYWSAQAEYGTAQTRLMDLAELEVACERVRRRIVIDMFKRGDSWQIIGDAIGLTRQGAKARYGWYCK